jgi:hypothetical protein
MAAVTLEFLFLIEEEEAPWLVLSVEMGQKGIRPNEKVKEKKKARGVRLAWADFLYTDQIGAYRAPHTPARGTGRPSSGVGPFFY